MYPISQQISDYLKKMNKFYSTRINSIHHGAIRIVVTQNKLFAIELVIKDHLCKTHAPHRPLKVDHVSSMDVVVTENPEKYDCVENGIIIFFIRNWSIYKQEIHITSMEDVTKRSGPTEHPGESLYA